MVNTQSVFALAALCFLMTQLTITSSQANYLLSPSLVSNSPTVAPVLDKGMLSSAVTSDVLGDADSGTFHILSNVNGLFTTTSTDMFSLVVSNPLNSLRSKSRGTVVPLNISWDANGSTVLSSADSDEATASAGTKLSRIVVDPFINDLLGRVLISKCISHASSIKDYSFASGELLEPLPGNAEGNQQPSQQYTAGRFRDYWSGLARLITSQSARVLKFHTGHDIVRTFEKSREKFVNDTQEPKIGFTGLHFNSATLMKSRYAPGTYISAAGDPIAVGYMTQMTGGVAVVYPTVTAETLFWLNARRPYVNFYVSDDPEFGFGFTGFKPGQGNTKVAGQVLFAGAVTFAPRYHKQLYGITG